MFHFKICNKALRLSSMFVMLFLLQACATSMSPAPVRVGTAYEQEGVIPAKKPVTVASINRVMVSGYYNAEPIQCVPYARQVSGFNIYGNAHTWWQQAANKGYEQGSTPERGAVLVLKKGRKLNYGHVAVVTELLSDREIEVAHSNWGNTTKTRRFIYETMRVKDVSAKNDWSALRFWNKYAQAYGSPYPNHGFIYAPAKMASVQ